MIDNRTKAAIHVAKAQLALTEDSYRDIMARVAGVRSSIDLDEAGARKLMAEFERLGFVNDTKKRRKGHDDRPLARKARALWISLHNLDEIDNADDRALAAFAKRLTGKETLRFCDTKELNQVVEALKGWCVRVDFIGTGARALVREQRRRLRAADQAFELQDLGKLDDAALYALANAHGEAVRRLQLGHRHHKSPTGQQGAAS